MGHSMSVCHWCDIGSASAPGNGPSGLLTRCRSLLVSSLHNRNHGMFYPSDELLRCMNGSCILAQSHFVHECSDGELVDEVLYEYNEGGPNYGVERLLASGSNGHSCSWRITCTEESREDVDCLGRHIARKT